MANGKHVGAVGFRAHEVHARMSARRRQPRLGLLTGCADRVTITPRAPPGRHRTCMHQTRCNCSRYDRRRGGYCRNERHKESVSLHRQHTQQRWERCEHRVKPARECATAKAPLSRTQARASNIVEHLPRDGSMDDSVVCFHLRRSAQRACGYAVPQHTQYSTRKTILNQVTRWLGGGGGGVRVVYGM